MRALLCILFLALWMNGQAQVGINATGSTPDNSAMLDVSSISKGFLVPRLTMAQRSTISSPATGLMFYQTDNTPGLYYNSGTPASPTWTYIATGINWSITGNSGTTAGSNFIGTTDNTPLTFKVFGQQSGKIDHSLFNTSLGYTALVYNSTGTANSAFGYNAMQNNTTGSRNTAIGNGALVTQSYNPGSVWYSENVALGYFSLYYNQPAAVTNGIYNTASGAYSLFKNTVGSNNTANGHSALFNNTTGYSNVAVGKSALYSNTTRNNLVAVGDSALYNNGQNVTYEYEAAYNTAVGSKSLFTNTNGYGNSATGHRSLYSNTTGYRNSGFGEYSLYANSLGANNTAIGSHALFLNTTGNNNVAIGTNALHNQSYSPGNAWNCHNIAVGFEALFSNQPTSTLNGIKNIAIGSDALHSNTTGLKNAAIGYRALYWNTLGSGNIAIGDEALYSNTQANYNIAAGWGAMFSNTMSNQNIAIGINALASQNYDPGYAWASSNIAVGYLTLYSNQSTSTSNGINNTATGNMALFANTIGSNNTADGCNALYSNTNGSYNTAVGYYADVSTTVGDATAIGANAITNANDKVVIGGPYPGIIVIGGYASWSTFSDGRFKEDVRQDVPGLSFIEKLNPVTYTVNKEGLVDDLTQLMPDSIARHYYRNEAANGGLYHKRLTGFIAQEVEAAARETGYEFDGVNAPKNITDNYSLSYASFVVPLVKAVQEQQQEIEQLKAKLAELESKLADK